LLILFITVRMLYLGHYTYHISSAGWGFPILDTAALMRALRVRLTELLSVGTNTAVGPDLGLIRADYFLCN